ncbi:HAD family phosphatase [Aquincola sp. MAHUQ-54]|uniref:HAD family phosphatase n=1 Tax=Aquincola agrisoli TaxID=3119538 RepID=A0AAW9Q8G5_9BURK
MRLALFDLDLTLIPFDSGMAWTRFLAAEGALPADAESAYLALCHRYVASELDIREMHRITVAPLAAFTRVQLDDWARRFELAMAPRLPADMQALVRRHREAGDLCAIVTATTRFIAEPFGRLFGIPHVLATEPALDARGVPTGAIVGEPCHREHKLGHVDAWLARQGLALSGFAESHFYSDAAGDLPLLSAVTHPVAVAPDAALQAHALQRGWPIVGQRPALEPPV